MPAEADGGLEPGLIAQGDLAAQEIAPRLAGGELGTQPIAEGGGSAGVSPPACGRGGRYLGRWRRSRARGQGSVRGASSVYGPRPSGEEAKVTVARTGASGSPTGYPAVQFHPAILCNLRSAMIALPPFSCSSRLPNSPVTRRNEALAWTESQTYGAYAPPAVRFGGPRPKHTKAARP